MELKTNIYSLFSSEYNNSFEGFNKGSGLLQTGNSLELTILLFYFYCRGHFEPYPRSISVLVIAFIRSTSKSTGSGREDPCSSWWWFYSFDKRRPTQNTAVHSKFHSQKLLRWVNPFHFSCSLTIDFLIHFAAWAQERFSKHFSQPSSSNILLQTTRGLAHNSIYDSWKKWAAEIRCGFWIFFTTGFWKTTLAGTVMFTTNEK